MASKSLFKQLRSVVLVSKRTRFEHEAEIFGMTNGALEEVLRNRGYPVERIVKSHEMHQSSIDHIRKEFEKRGIDTSLVYAQDFEKLLHGTSLSSFDAVFSAGGDGTALQTALSVKSNKVPVVTINTDPQLSSGCLCAFQLTKQKSTDMPNSGTFETALDKLEREEFDWFMRSRIKVKVTLPTDNEHTSLDRYALNEFFFSERDASRPAVHDTAVIPVDRKTGEVVSIGEDGATHESYVQRSSGVIVCTGTGSTAWMSSASKVSNVDVNRILNEASQVCGLPTMDDDQISKIAESINRDCIFSGDEEFVQYFVREPVLNGWYGRHDTKLSVNPRRGFAKEVKLKAKGWEPVITIDGLSNYPVPYGTKISLTIDPNVSLRTVKFN